MSHSNLDLVNECDNFPYFQTDPELYLSTIKSFYQFRIIGHDYNLGYVLAHVAEIFRNLEHWTLDDEQQTLTLGGSTPEERSDIIMKTSLALKETGHFKVLEKWRNELYPIYGKNREILFHVERAASALFGVVTYGAHCTAYVKTAEGEMKIWIPRRAKTKHTFPGMLDNAVAGGIAAGEGPFESLVRECAEEASLSEDLVRSRAKAAGTVTYFYIRDSRAGGEAGLLQPEVQYIYDLELPADVVPKPGDDEVEEFYLWTIEQVMEGLRKAEFKPNCALIMIDFFIRHGVLTQENERDYVEIVARAHRRFEFPTL